MKIVSTRAALVLGTAALAACTATPAAPTASPSASPSPAATATPSPSPSASPSPMSTSSPSPKPTATPIASYTTTGECSITVDRAPALDETMYFTAAGFEAGQYLKVHFDGPTNDFDFEEPVQNVRIEPDGAFSRPWDVTFSGAEEVGRWTVTFTDGSCEASATFEVAEN